MKHERLCTGLMAWVLSFLISTGSIGCLMTVFSLRLTNARVSVLLWAGAALVLSALLSFRRGGTMVLYLLALGGGYLWYDGRTAEQLLAVIYQITRVFDGVYHWGILIVAERIENILFTDFALTVWVILTQTAVCCSVCRRKSCAPAVLLALLPLEVCMCIPHKAPAWWELLALLTGLLMLILTAGARKESAAQGNRLGTGMLLPAVVAAAVLLAAFPSENYVDHSEKIRNLAMFYGEKLPGMIPEHTDNLTLFAPQRVPKTSVDLSALNGQNIQQAPIMKVTAEQSGTLYLRGQDYDVYTGTGWESSGRRSEDFSGWGESTERVKIHTYGLHELIYVPYYPAGGTVLQNGMIRNVDHLLEYTVSRCRMGSAAGADTLSACTQLPDATLDGAKKYLPEEPGDNVQRANRIADLVRGSAVYDRTTGRMPETETDFALWFLNQSETGYCVHFATAAVVLLRAAGIPARYVTGYKAETVSGEETVVTSLDAHAWAEFYDPELGSWTVLEATPGDLSVGEPIAEESAAQPVEEPENSVPAEAAAPGPEQPEEENHASGRIPLKKLGRCLLTVLFLGILVIFQRTLRLWLRRMRQQRRANDRALYLWRDTEQLAKLLGEEPPEALLELAQKARFSQHTLNGEELALFLEYGGQCRRKLEKKAWYYRFLYRYVYVIY